MLTAAVWTDFDNDKQTDLIIAGEWMPVRFFKNNRGILQEVTASTGLTQMNGMWRSLIATDIDNDGDIDFVAGNLGLNCLYKVSDANPMQLFAADIDGNGVIDPVFFYYIKDNDGVRRSFPANSRNQLAEQVPAIKKDFYCTRIMPAPVLMIFLKEKQRTIWFNFPATKPAAAGWKILAMENLQNIFCQQKHSLHP